MTFLSAGVAYSIGLLAIEAFRKSHEENSNGTLFLAHAVVLLGFALNVDSGFEADFHEHLQGLIEADKYISFLTDLDKNI